jgi:hypothetical protein
VLAVQDVSPDAADKADSRLLAAILADVKTKLKADR